MTGRAAGVAITGIVSISTGVLLHWTELAAVGMGILALSVVPAILRSPRGATWTDRSAPVRVVRGESALLEIDVIVPDGPVTWVSAVNDDGSDRVFLPQDTRNAECPLSWPIDTSRRGEFLVGPSRLEFADPCGLSRRVLATRRLSPVLVVPRVHGLDSGFMAQATDQGIDGELAGSDSFESLREYVVGDPLKRVHWPTSARAGKLMVKRMVDTTIPWLLVVLDVNARAYDRPGALFADFDPDAFEDSVDTAASWAWHSCTSQQRVLLTTTSLAADRPVLAAEVTSRTRESALDALATVDSLEDSECGPGRVSALSRRQGVGRILLVTGRNTATSSAWVSAWRRHLPVTVVVGHS